MCVKRPAHERFLDLVVIKDGCWGWNGYKDWGGYGRLMIKDGPVRAHRFSYEFHCGEIPEGKFILHHCDNRECTNPDHLYAGTHEDNMADKVARGRAYTGNHKGEVHPQAKLTNADVYEIRASAEPNPSLARKYGVSAGAIGLIKRRQTWAHLT